MGDTLAAIDVGTNSFHLVVARVVGDDRFEVVGREKEMVRLGSGAGDMKVLAADAIDRGVATLARFRQVADISGAPVRAVATSAVREAENHDEFLRRAELEAGVHVEVISGVEEARLIHLGVLQAVPVFDRPLFLVDIGGGSTELLFGYQGEARASRSLKLGAVRLTNRFFAGDRLHPSALSSCRSYVRSVLMPFAHETGTLGFEVAIASSGTAQAVAQISVALRGGDSPQTWNRHELAADDVGRVVARLAKAHSVAERRKVPGLDPKRADIILAGALLLEQVVDVFGVEQLVISDYALREGVLLDTLQRTRGLVNAPHHLRELSRRSVAHLAEACDEDPLHSTHVARLALQLFDATRPQHGLDDGCREYLEAGALLANVGLFISHSQHHRHSYYVIRNSERLTGFTDAEIEIIAQVARYHRKSAPKASHPEFARLGPDDQALVRALAALLRVAIGLDRTHDGRVGAVTARLERGQLVISAHPAGEADLGLELYTAADRSTLLAEVLGRPVRVVAGTPALAEQGA